MELAGAQINANDGAVGREEERRVSGLALRFQTKGSPIMENAQPRRPLGPRSPSAQQSPPLSQP